MKVDDTLIVTVEDEDGEDVDLTTGDIQWFAGNEPIDGETDDTLDVTDNMVGLQIFVEFTDAEGKTHESDATEPVYVYSFEIEDAKASKVNEIKVTFANPVEAENVTFAVTKGTEDFPIEKVEATDWSLDEKEVTLKTSANMAKGTYTVTATDSVTKDTAYANFEVTKQEVEGIVILNKTALTNRSDVAADNHKEAYSLYRRVLRTLVIMRRAEAFLRRIVAPVPKVDPVVDPAVDPVAVPKVVPKVDPVVAPVVVLQLRLLLR